MEKPQQISITQGNGYPKEFREEAVRYWLSSGKKVKEVAQELGVSDWSLSRWHKEMEAIAPSTGQATSAQTTALNATALNATALNALELAKENGRLRRENEALLRQREILKKAISIFSAESPIGGSR